MKELGCLSRALERLLGGFREALGRLLEASKRYLGPKTVIANIFRRFWKKYENLGVHLGDVLRSKIVFFRVPRGYPTYNRLWRRFRIDFKTISEGFARAKMWFSYHSGTIFEDVGRWNISSYLRGVLGGSWGRFSEIFG